MSAPVLLIVKGVGEKRSLFRNEFNNKFNNTGAR